MNKPLLLLILVLCATISFASGINKPVTSQYGFIENKGQIIDQNNNLNPSVLYLYNGNSLHVQLKQNGFSYEVWKIAAGPQPIATSQSPLPEANSQKPTADSNYIHRIDISFVDANPNAKITASEPASDYINYYTTGTSEKGATNVHHYKKVLYQNIYNNIDVEFCLSDGSSSPSGSPPAGQEGLGGASFKYNFIVRPGGNVNDIQLQFDGANSTSLTSDGHITIETAYGNIDESIPSTYQINNDNAKQSIKSNFKQQTSNTFDIEVSNYDKTKTLIIDPLPWGTYIGTNAGDWGYGITSDIDGFVLVTGQTTSLTTIATSGAYQTALAGSIPYHDDAFIIKFDPTGSVQWGTYFGGSGIELASAIATDSSKCIYITGYTNSTSSIATTGAYQSSCSSCPSASDAFIAKFDSAGMLLWGTYLGGPAGDIAYGIAVDPKRNVIITGLTSSSTGIATTGSYMSSFGGSTDAFVSKFSTSGSMIWSTYFGSVLYDRAYGVTTDSIGNVYVIGSTNSTTGIASIGAYQTINGGGYDAFLVKFDSSGNKHWSTYYGSDLYDLGLAVTTDNRGNVYFTGLTRSGAMITSPGAHQLLFGGGSIWGDAMIVKFTSLGTRVWATYYGGSGDEKGTGIATDAIGNVFVTGYTSSSTAIATAGTNNTSFMGGTGGGNSDAFIVKLNTNCIRQWGTYYGGTGDDGAESIAVSNTSSVLITGYTGSATGIAFGNAYQSSVASVQDVFVASFSSYGGLPVQLINFDAQLENSRQVLCTWQTASELNNDYFEIERNVNSPIAIGPQTTDHGWEAISKVKGNGTTNSVHSYQFTDDLSTVHGQQSDSYRTTVYYRLKQVDFDGKSSLSEVRAIHLGKDINTCSVYPNPNSGTFTINFSNTQGEKQIAIYNLQGKLVAHYTTTESVYEVKEQLPHGMYFIKAETTQGSFNTKFVVE